MKKCYFEICLKFAAVGGQNEQLILPPLRKSSQIIIVMIIYLFLFKLIILTLRDATTNTYLHILKTKDEMKSLLIIFARRVLP